MVTDALVQFVYFETSLDREHFAHQWEQFDYHSDPCQEITLQQSEKKGVFRYLAQHRYNASNSTFTFKKATRSFRFPEVEIKAKPIGGYSITQLLRPNGARSGEVKVFVFLQQASRDLEAFQSLSDLHPFNIYEAYYENCQYAQVFEFFVKEKGLAACTEKLKVIGQGEIVAYKEFALQTA